MLAGVDVLISAISAHQQLQQKNLADAAKIAGVKRFLPCAFTTVAPPGGVMMLRDHKEEVYQHVKDIGIPYTVVDVGYWYQGTFPRLPSGRVDYASLMPISDIHGDGEAPNLLIDKRDIGHFVARIILDERTINKYVCAYGEVLTENQLFAIMEEVSGEKINPTYVCYLHIHAPPLYCLPANTHSHQVSDAETESRLSAAKTKLAEAPEDRMSMIGVYLSQYQQSCYVRQDNQPKVAKELGYLDAHELYPDLKPVTFREFAVELLDGKIAKPYAAGLPI